jgi:hypothetical protein
MKQLILLLAFLLLPALAFAQGLTMKTETTPAMVSEPLTACASCTSAKLPATEPAAQQTFTVQVRFQFTGATSAEARQSAVEYIGRFLEAKIAADIHQRNGQGELILDGKGEKQFDPAKVQAVFLEYLKDFVDEGSTAGRVSVRVAAQSKAIEAEERGKTKPVVQ